MFSAIRKVVSGLAVFAMSATALVMIASPASASTYCGNSGCGPYRIHFVYGGGSSFDDSYASQYEWMVSATRGDEHGYLQQSGYVSMTVSDSNNGFATTATFNPTGTKHIGTYGNGIPGDYDWTESYASPGTNCSSGGGYYGYEASVWAWYLTEVAYYHAGSNDGTQIVAAAYNGARNAFGVGCLTP